MPNMQNRLCDTFCSLVKIPSPSRRERAVAEWICAYLNGLGLNVEEDNASENIGGKCNNLRVVLPATGNGPTLFLSAHMDTVERGDCAIDPQINNGRITSAGATILGGDDKCGVAALLECITRLHESPVPHSELRFCFSVAEEVELLGASAFQQEWLDGCDAGIVLDHGTANEIVIAAPSKAALRITTHGTGGHAAFPRGQVNAAHALALAVSRLPSGQLDELSTANIGILRAGDAINIIPAEAYAEYELRSHEEARLQYYLENTLATIEAAVREHRHFDGRETTPPKATVDVDVKHCYTAYAHDASTPVVQLACDAMRACGTGPSLVRGQGGSDANILNARGVPTVNLGCGMHSVHGPNEYADLAEMEHAVRVLLALIHTS